MYPALATQTEYELMLFYFLANVVLFSEQLGPCPTPPYNLKNC